jgi:DNA (cytosine-5)-methyltransferase 1
MADARGNLALEYLRLAERLRPRWIVWENVPGVLSSNEGRDFGSFLGGLVECGYGFAYRVLDAQYFGLAQRRKRVFVVGYLGDWRRAAAVLFEPESLRGHPAPRRKTGQRVAPTVARGSPGGRTYGLDADTCDSLVATVSLTLRAGGNQTGGNRPPGTDVDTADSLIPVMTLAIRGRGDSHDLEIRTDGLANALLTPNGGRAGIGVGAVAYRTSPNCGAWETGDRVDALTTGSDPTSHIIGFTQNQRDEVRLMDVAGALAAEPGAKQQTYAQKGMAVRRLMPIECERLQGFPDNYTNVPYRGKPMADGPRYKELGNSMAVNVMAWIGKRLLQVESTKPQID